jgi:hypothetical protein
MDDQRKYRARMTATVIGILLSIPAFLAVLFFVLAYFFNPFRPY